MKFTELNLYASTLGLEAVGGVLDSAGVSCCSIQDPADLEALLADRTVPADYVEESLRAQNGEPFLSVYLAQNAQGEEQKNAILAGIETLRGDFGDTLGSLRRRLARQLEAVFSSAGDRRTLRRPPVVGALRGLPRAGDRH